MKKTITILALLAAWFGATATADAAREQIGISMEASPTAGALYKEVHRPVAASLTVTVSNPSSETTITPLKVANVTFPSDMDFFPNPGKTPACPESKLNDQSDLAAGLAAIVADCPRSVVGTGTAIVHLARDKSTPATLTDPRLVIFNTGRNDDGRPGIAIYGYSAKVHSGLLMRGTLARDGQLKIDVGVLPFDSSVSTFTLGIPGEPIGTGEGSSVVGLDSEYLRAECSTGTWRATGNFVLGRRDSPGGTPIGEETFLSSNAFELPCKGLRGKPRLKLTRLKGPKRIGVGHTGRYRMTISNAGTATAKAVRLKVSGAARGLKKLGALGPGDSRTIRVRVRASSRKKAAGVKFMLGARGTEQQKAFRKLRVG